MPTPLRLAGLTPANRRVLDALIDLHERRGNPVPAAALARHLRLSGSGVRQHLAALVECGMAEKQRESCGRSAAGYVPACRAALPLAAALRIVGRLRAGAVLGASELQEIRAALESAATAVFRPPTRGAPDIRLAV